MLVVVALLDLVIYFPRSQPELDNIECVVTWRSGLSVSPRPFAYLASSVKIIIMNFYDLHR